MFHIQPVLLFLYFLFLPHVQSLSVLLFVPTLSFSHVAFNGKIADSLVESGHQVVMLIPVVDPSVQANGTKLAKVIRTDTGTGPGVLNRVLWQNPGPYEDSSPLNPVIFSKLLRVSGLFLRACQVVASNRELMSELYSYNFDVGITEQYQNCGFGIFTALGIRSTLWMSATALFRVQPEALGINFPLSYVPELFAHVSDEMSLFEKTINVLIATATGLTHSIYFESAETSIFHRLQFLSSDTNLLKISQQSHSLLINSHPFFDFPMPQSNQVVHLGGIAIESDHKKLQGDWQEVADKAVGGFILVTFGSIARTVDMPIKMREAFYTAFRIHSNITFILKQEEVEPDQVLWVEPNLVLARWLPQISLMAHTNFRGIITHGGWSSILETIYFGRPLILMPLFADHAKNSQVVQAKGVGLLIDKMKTESNVLIESIRRITQDKRFGCILTTIVISQKSS